MIIEYFEHNNVGTAKDIIAYMKSYRVPLDSRNHVKGRGLLIPSTYAVTGMLMRMGAIIVGRVKVTNRFEKVWKLDVGPSTEVAAKAPSTIPVGASPCQ